MMFPQKRESLMKNIWLAPAMLAVALWTGCATGGSGHTGPSITVAAAGNAPNIAVTLTLQFTATVKNSNSNAVTWSVQQSGTVCSPTCGTVDANGLYTAPATVPSTADVDVTATLQSDTSVKGSLSVTVLNVSTTVTPTVTNNTNNPVDIVKGTTQQFTARSLPDDKRAQPVTWSLACDAGGSACGTIDAGTGLFTAPATVPSQATGTITATSTIDPTGPPGWTSNVVNIAITKSRLAEVAYYAFRLSGFDTAGNPTAVVGNFQTDGNGAIPTNGGEEDELNGTDHVIRTISSGSLSITNNVHGTLTLTTSAGTHTYKVVFNAAGDGKLIQFDSSGRASGEIVQATKSKFNASALVGCQDKNNNSVPCVFTFGLTGEDTVSRRAGAAGLFKVSTAGVVDSAMLDINQTGGLISPPGLVGTYDVQSNGRGTLTLTNGGSTFGYAIYMVGGAITNDKNPLTLFMISTDDPQSNPAVSGTIVLQDPKQTYDNSGLNQFFVASLTGLDNNGNSMVSLTLGTGDGAGKISASFDANNGGTKVSAQTFTCDYTAGTDGRYTLSLLGNGTSCTNGVPLILYANAESRGFLLDPSSSSVFTGQMDQQPLAATLGPSQMAGSFAAATVNPGNPNVNSAAMNLLFTSLQPDFTVAGVQDVTGDPSPETFTGTYTVAIEGTGTMVLTQPTASNYVMYPLDNPKSFDNMIQHFVMINVDSSNTNPAVIFGER